MKGYIIDTKEIDGMLVHKVKHDINGNPRYIIAKYYISTDYKEAVRKGRKVGFTQCRAVGFDLYLICSTYKGYSGVVELIEKTRNEK